MIAATRTIEKLEKYNASPWPNGQMLFMITSMDKNKLVDQGITARSKAKMEKDRLYSKLITGRLKAAMKNKKFGYRRRAGSLNGTMGKKSTYPRTAERLKTSMDKNLADRTMNRSFQDLKNARRLIKMMTKRTKTFRT